MNDKWVHFGTDWFNLSDFCHIWIETRQKIEQIKYGPLDTDYINTKLYWAQYHYEMMEFYQKLIS